MTDDAIRERHGVTARQTGFSDLGPIMLIETDNEIVMEDTRNDISLTIWQARYLARKLYRLARRIETRNQEQM